MAVRSARISGRDVALAAGVSLNTVSLVVRDSPLVAVATKERVRRVIDELGYRPHAAAAALASARSSTLGYVVARVEEPSLDVFRHQLVSAMTTCAQAADHYLLIDTFVDAPRCAALISSGRIDGVLIDYMIDDIVLHELLERGAPVVLVGRDAGDLPVSWVKADEEEGSYQAIRHLIDLGHRRFALIAAGLTGHNSIASERIHGYRRALHEAGLPDTPRSRVHGDWTFQSGYALAQQLLRTPSRPTAIFALSEQMAVGAIQAAQGLGLRIPDDVAVVTTEDSPWVEFVQPRLTAVHVPMYDVGLRATEILLELLEHPETPPQRIVLPTKFVVRESTVRTD